MFIPTGTNRMVLCSRPRGAVAADRGSSEEEMTEVEQEVKIGEARYILMTETEIATTPLTEIETLTAAGALATKM